MKKWIVVLGKLTKKIGQKFQPRRNNLAHFEQDSMAAKKKTFLHHITFVLGKLTNMIGQKMLARDKQSSLFWARLNDDKEKTNIFPPYNICVE